MSNTHSKTTPTATATEAARSSTPSTGSSGTASKPSLPPPPTSLDQPPSPPAGYTPTPVETKRKYRKLSSALVPGVAQVAAELKGSTTYQQDFGSFAPAQDTLVSMLVAVGLFEAALGPAERWVSYINDERLAIDDAALTMIGQLAKLFKANLAQDSALSLQYPALVAFLDARAAPAARATATKKKTKKTAAEKASSTPAPAASSSVPAAPAEPAPAPAPAAAGTGR